MRVTPESQSLSGSTRLTLLRPAAVLGGAPVARPGPQGPVPDQLRARHAAAADPAAAAAANSSAAANVPGRSTSSLQTSTASPAISAHNSVRLAMSTAALHVLHHFLSFFNISSSLSFPPCFPSVAGCCVVSPPLSETPCTAHSRRLAQRVVSLLSGTEPAPCPP